MPLVGFEPHNPSKRAAADPRLRPRGHLDRPTRFNVKIFYMVITLRRVFRTDVRTDSGPRFIRHYPIGFYSHGGKCLQRGTD